MSHHLVWEGWRLRPWFGGRDAGQGRLFDRSMQLLEGALDRRI